MTTALRRELLLCVPGLRGVPGLRHLFRDAADHPGLALLGQALGRGKALPGGEEAAGVYGNAARLCGLAAAAADETAQPLASWSLWGESQETPPPAGGWLRADPVWLEADRDRVVLRDLVSLDAAQARVLVTLLNEHLSAEGLHIEAVSPRRWYLRMQDEQARALQTWPPYRALGQDIHPFMPAGPAGGRWRRLLNEIQMLLHECPVNAARREAGQPPVNSVWFWGGGGSSRAAAGQTQADSRTVALQGVWSDDPVLRGLGRVRGAACAPLPPDAAAWLAHAGAGTHLVFCDAPWLPALRGEPEEWADCLAQWQRDWLAPLLEALKTGDLDALRLYDGGGTGWDLAGWRRPRFWPVRRRAFREWL